MNVVIAKESADQGLIIREPAFVFHYDRIAGQECFGSRKTVTKAAQIAAER